VFAVDIAAEEASILLWSATSQRELAERERQNRFRGRAHTIVSQESGYLGG